MRITISGKAFVYDAEGQEILTSDTLRSLDGLIYDEETFTEYLGGRDTAMVKQMLVAAPDDESLIESLREAELENAVRVALEDGGKLRFVYQSEPNELWCVTEYRSNRRLNEQELKVLADYTEAQWSDGIGENFSSGSEDAYGYLIDCRLCGPNFNPILKASVEQAEA